MLTRVGARRWAVSCLSALAATAFCAPADDFGAAYAKAEAACMQAHALRNEWITMTNGRKWTTAQGLQLAKAQAVAGQYDEALKTAREVDTLARAEIEQANEQASDWPQAAIR